MILIVLDYLHFPPKAIILCCRVLDLETQQTGVASPSTASEADGETLQELVLLRARVGELEGSRDEAKPDGQSQGPGGNCERSSSFALLAEMEDLRTHVEELQVQTFVQCD